MKNIIGILCMVALVAVIVFFLYRERTVESPPMEEPSIGREKPREPGKEEIAKRQKEREEEEFRAFEKRWEGKQKMDLRDEIKGITTVEGKVDRLIKIWYWEKRIKKYRSFDFSGPDYCRITREIGIEAIPYLMGYLMKKESSQEDNDLKHFISTFWLENIRKSTTRWEAVREFFDKLPVPLKEKAGWALHLAKWDRNGYLWYPRGMEYAPYMLEFLFDPDPDIAKEAESFFCFLKNDSPEVADQKRALIKENLDRFEKLCMERGIERGIGWGAISYISEDPAVKAFYQKYLERPGAHKNYRSEQDNLFIIKRLKEYYGKDTESIDLIVKTLQAVPDELKNGKTMVKKDEIEEEYRVILASLGHEESFQIVLKQIDRNLRDGGTTKLSYLAETKDPRLVPYMMKWLTSDDPVKEAWLAGMIMEKLSEITGFDFRDGKDLGYSIIACGDVPGTCGHHAHIAKYYRLWMEWWEQNRQKYR